VKRIMIATLSGLVAGRFCATAAFAGGFLKFTAVNLVWILLNRAVMGLAISTSGLKLRWAWNGIVMGLVVGSIFSYFLFMNLGPVMLPPVNALANGIFGLMIEFFPPWCSSRWRWPHLARSSEPQGRKKVEVPADRRVENTGP
jgi:hypothetical protein